MIYFIKSESGHVKIGHTDNDIEYRASQLQTGNPFKLSILKTIDFPKSQETFIHQKFDSARCEGEWFLLNDDISKFIESPYLIKPKKELKPTKTYKQRNLVRKKTILCEGCGRNYRQENEEICWICKNNLTRGIKPKYPKTDFRGRPLKANLQTA